MQTYKILALDESGKASLNHGSKNFILSGLIIPEKFKLKLDNAMRKLKRKYFDDEEIIFHSRDMLRKRGPFAIFRTNSKKELLFWSEFINIANQEEISFAIIVIDKEKAKKLGWNEIAILRKAYSKMLEEFAKKHLLDNTQGKIIAETDPSQDKYLIEAHSRLQTIGIPAANIAGNEYRRKLTSLSFVNKLNLDIDIQMADNLAIMADMIYEIKIGKKQKMTKVESMMRRLIERKIASKTNPGIFEALLM